jgi:DNA modification methylase
MITPYFRRETIGNCTLYLADCRSVLPDVEIDAVVTDPPFGIGYRSNYATDELWKAGRRIAGDECTALRDQVLAYFATKPCLVFGSWKAARPAGTRQILIWDKGGALGMGALDIPWKPDHEEIYVLGKGFIGRRDSGSVLKCPPVQSMAKNGRLHPNQKPVRLLRELVRKVPGTVFDPFMGVGSTGVACVELGRPFVGVEVEERFFDIACERIREASRQGDLLNEIVEPTADEGDELAKSGAA